MMVSLLGWTSFYNLTDTNNPTQPAHTCIVVGSRTGQATVLFDNKPIIGFTVTGFTSGATKLGSIQWTQTADRDWNTIITFAHVAVSPRQSLPLLTADAKPVLRLA